MRGAQSSLLADGRRLHLHHGPIDLIVEVVGPGRNQAYARAVQRFQSVLEELVSELTLLRTQGRVDRNFVSPIARRMQTAISPYCEQFVTPMAAVAGSVADDVLLHLGNGDGVHKAYVNNGGDIAFHLAPGEAFIAALASVPGGRATLCSQSRFRGIATSGWRGRSQSLGIADAVTVVARDAASADVAATLIANAVDLPGCPAIGRVEARTVDPDSDLGDRLVTTSVGTLTGAQIRQALERGKATAKKFVDRGLVGAVCLQLRDVVDQVGSLALERSRPQSQQFQELTHA